MSTKIVTNDCLILILTRLIFDNLYGRRESDYGFCVQFTITHTMERVKNDAFLKKILRISLLPINYEMRKKFDQTVKKVQCHLAFSVLAGCIYCNMT